MYYELFDIDDPKFNRELANRYVLTIKKGSSIRAVDAAKINLYKLMKKVIVKSVKNYVKLTVEWDVADVCPTEQEMYAEAFITLMKCVENFKVKKGHCFYFYLSKALSRNFLKIITKEVRSRDRHKDFRAHVLNNDTVDCFRDDIYSVEFLIEYLDLDEFDKEVLMSKLEFEKKDDFIVNNDGASINKYYASIRKIKSQLQKLKDDGDI